MPLLKEKYHHLNPKKILYSESPTNIFNEYISEFHSEKKFTFENFVAVVLNAIRDYLENKIDEKTLASLMHVTYISDITKQFHEGPHLWKHNPLLTLISELTDISWLKESESFPEYRKRLRHDWAELVTHYEKFFNRK